MVSFWLLAIVAICVLGLADDVIRHAVLVVVAGIVAITAACLGGRRHGRRLATIRPRPDRALARKTPADNTHDLFADAIIASVRPVSLSVTMLELDSEPCGSRALRGSRALHGTRAEPCRDSGLCAHTGPCGYGMPGGQIPPRGSASLPEHSLGRLP